MCRLLTLHFCFSLGAMDNLFSFNDVVNAIQDRKPQKMQQEVVGEGCLAESMHWEQLVGW